MTETKVKKKEKVRYKNFIKKKKFFFTDSIFLSTKLSEFVYVSFELQFSLVVQFLELYLDFSVLM